MNDEQSRDVQHLYMFLIVVGVIGMMWTLAGGGFLAWRDGIEHSCVVEGPFPESRPYPALIPREPERAYISLLPFGRACDWRGDDGQVVTALPDWNTTSVFFFFAAMATTGGILIGRGEKRAKSSSISAG